MSIRAAAAQDTPVLPSSQSGAQAVLPEEMQKQILVIVADPRNRALWNALEMQALEHKFYIWVLNVPILARGIIKDGKSAVAVSESMAGDKMPEAIVKAWLEFALFQIVVQSPEWQKENSTESGKAPFLAEYLPLEEMVKNWEASKKKDSSLHDDKLDVLARMYEANVLPAYTYLNHFDPDRRESFRAWGKQNEAMILKLFREFILVPQNAIPEYAKADIDREYHSDGPAMQAHIREHELSAGEKNRLEEEIKSLKTLLQKMSLEEAQPQHAGTAHLMIGTDLSELQRYNAALEELQTALQLLIKADDQEGIANARLRLGRTQAAVHHYDAAAQSLAKAVAGFAAMPAQLRLQALALTELAESESKLENYDEAVKHAGAIFALAADHHDAALQELALFAAQHVYITMYTGISWNTISGRERDTQDADFVNDGDVGESGAKYGRRSPDEDEATFRTFVQTQCNRKIPEAKDCPLTEHVRREMAAGNFAPAAKYLFFKFVHEYYLPSLSDKGFGIQGVSIAGGEREFVRATCEEENGNSLPLGKLLVEAGLLKESDLSSWAKREKSGRQTENDLTFSEVKHALNASLQAGVYVPDNIVLIINKFEEAYNFRVSHNLKTLCERLGVVEK